MPRRADVERAWHYLDHAATTPLRPEALAAMVPALRDGVGNPSGAHVLARRARAALDGAREQLAEVVGCQPGEIVFTSGGTEADNLAVRGVLGASSRGTVVCSAIEHHAVLHPVTSAGGRVVPVDRHGVIDLGALASSLDEDVALVSVMLVNNETGTIQPLAAIADVIHERAPGALLHTDAAQALCWLDVREAAAAADLVTLASHKCGGPVGTGALVIRAGATIEPQQLGGGQERDRRSGTQDVAGALGFAAAAMAADRERTALVARAARWRDELVSTVLAGVPGAVESAVPPGTARHHLIGGMVNVCLPAVDSEALLFVLEQDHRVLASAASSCASGAQEPSHVLAALGIERSLAVGSLRLSLGWSSTDDDVAAAKAGVPVAARRLQEHARDGAPA
jgi:cysteine desulfurase